MTLFKYCVLFSTFRDDLQFALNGMREHYSKSNMGNDTLELVQDQYLHKRRRNVNCLGLLGYSRSPFSRRGLEAI